MNSVGYFTPSRGRPHFVSHFQYSGENRFLSMPECDAVLSLAENRGYGAAAVGNPDSVRLDEKYRCARVSMLEFNKDTSWLYELVTRRVMGANEHFDFILSGLLEAFQVIRYDAPAEPSGEAGHYDWHQDFGGDYMARRKLSVVVQLSSPDDYDGCRLTIMDPGPRELSGTYQERGAGVIFPSWMPHCVTPITRGVRYALVAWVHGTPFR